MEDLRECPFCGSNCINDTTEPKPDKLGMYYWVCPCCVSCGPSAVSVKEASRLWNTRPTPEAIKDIEWVGECAICEGKGALPMFSPEFNKSDHRTTCMDCKGEGTITRQATMQEVVEVMVKLLSLKLDVHNEPECPTCTFKEALKVNNGQLKIRNQDEES